MNGSREPVPNGCIRVKPNATNTGRGSAAVSLNGDLLRELIAVRLPGGKAELQDRWAFQPVAGADRGEPDAPHRSTMHRWTSGKVPGTAADLLRLCSLLDVDPLSLLCLPDTQPELALERLMSAYVHGRWDPPALSFLKEFLGRRPIWPPTDLARQYYGREWVTRDYVYEAAPPLLSYATFRLRSCSVHHTDGPFVYHVAFRHGSLFGRRWLQYGLLIRHGREATLRHINGYVASASVAPSTATEFQTWFGPGSAIFRVACLHPFELEVDLSTGAHPGALRFPG